MNDLTLTTNQQPFSISSVTFTISNLSPELQYFFDKYAPLPGDYGISLGYVVALSGSLDAELNFRNNMKTQIRNLVVQMFATSSAYCKSLNNTGSWAL